MCPWRSGRPTARLPSANSGDVSVHSASTRAAAIVGVGASHLAWNPTSNRWIDTWDFHVDRSSERRENFGIV